MTRLLLRKATAFLLLFLVSINVFAQRKSAPKIDQGVLDLREWNFADHKIALTGYWNFVENELISNPQAVSKQVYFPEVFAKTGHEDVNVATYSVRVFLPGNTGKLAFEIPQLYSSYVLSVNGKAIAANGKPGTSKESTTPQWRPQVVSFERTSDTLNIVLQIANFYHHNGGAKQPIYLGTATMLEGHHTIAMNSNLAECLILFVLGFSFFVIYYVRQEKKKITLYFSLLCISWAIRSVFSNNYLFIDYYPNFDWTWMVRIEYITLYSMLIWAVLFFSRLFLKESSKMIKYILVGVNCVFIAETLILPPAFFTKWILVYLVVAGLLLIHSTVITIRALLNERAGVWYLVVSLVLGLMLFTYDMFVFEGFFQYYDAFLFSVGYIVIFILMGIALFYHLKIFKGDGSSGTLTFDELYGSEARK